MTHVLHRARPDHEGGDHDPGLYRNDVVANLLDPAVELTEAMLDDVRADAVDVGEQQRLLLFGAQGADPEC
ncbi:hypothetical protein [Aestuariimicrobium ganziense]|uniref:hypothetical protein n=1 Tax=Aestuariimicrobium ganziense TaxID=2773677 RepID=UPI001940B412|nr:hypothetical protein [Aestuariimicrobium ganziense]